jgi:protein-tyrosine phosphatase
MVLFRNPGFIRAHGRKLGYARHLVARLQHRVGLLDRYSNVAWDRVERVVFVCRGNICRSAYAATAIRRHTSAPIASFGLEAGAGVPAAGAAVRAAARRGVSLDAHRASPAASVPLTGGDLLVAFEPWQVRALAPAAAAHGAQVLLLGQLLDPPRPHIEDPYGLDDSYFDACFDVIDAAIARLVDAWRPTAGSR